MDNSTGGPDYTARQRQAAAEIARKKVLAAYSSYQPKDEKAAVESAASNAKQNTADWKRYHSAWQNYYQKYYSDYYSKAAREFVAGERQKLAEEKAALAAARMRQVGPQPQPIIQQQPTPQPIPSAEPQPAAAPTLEQNLKALASEKSGKSQAKKIRRRKFMPLIAGVSVIFLILFLQYNRLIFAPIAAYVSPGEAPSSEITALDPTITSAVSADPKLIIPSLNVEVPVAFGIPLANMNSAMNQGVAQFRIQGASAYPGEIGNLVISGHSAGDIYSNNQYKFIFSGLERLKEGDLIYINYKSTRYTYQMTKSAVVEPTDIAALTGETDKPQLILVTCTPLGTSRYRLLVYADQISPSYQDAEVASEPEEDGTETMPENEPTLFENIWNWLTGRN